MQHLSREPHQVIYHHIAAPVNAVWRSATSSILQEKKPDAQEMLRNYGHQRKKKSNMRQRAFHQAQHRRKTFSLSSRVKKEDQQRRRQPDNRQTGCLVAGIAYRWRWLFRGLCRDLFVHGYETRETSP